MNRWITFLALSLFLPGAFSAPAFAAPAVEDGPPPSHEFRVLDIGERTYQNGPAVAVVVSKPLDPTVRHDAHIRISDTRRLLKSAWVISDDGRTLYFPHVEPETQYSVSVLETLTAADGATLGERVSATVETRQVTPIISFASDGFVLPAGESKGLPLVTVNVDGVYAEFYRMGLDGLLSYVRWGDTTRRADYYELARAGNFGEMVFSGRFDLDAPPNRRAVRHIPVQEIAALSEPGVYLAILRRPGEFRYDYPSAYFVVTDIGLHARTYEDESLVFASSLKTGNPLSGVALTFLGSKGEEIAAGRTDKEGAFAFSGPLPGKVRLVTARSGDSAAVLPLSLPALDLSEFELGDRVYRARELFLYSPRNLYRPGETATVSGLLRDHDGRPEETIPLTAKLFRPDGREARTFAWRAEETGAGYYQTEIPFPADAPTGRWQLRVWTDPSASAPMARYDIQVEDFLPERMKLNLTAEPERPGPEDDLRVRVEGDYLYGAPAAGNRIAGRVHVRPVREPFDGRPGFRFGREADQGYRDDWNLDEGALDDSGETEILVESRWESIRSPLTVQVAVDLFETGGRPVTRAATKTVWPGDPLVGIRPLFDPESVEPGAVGFELIRVGPDGGPAPAAELKATLIREERDYYWEYAESGGWQYKYTEKTYPYRTDMLTVGGEGESYRLHLERGHYLLKLHDPETDLTTSLRFQVGWWSAGREDTARPDRVGLSLDRPAYRPGDIIKLTVTPPHPGEAIIAVEGNKPLWTRRVSVAAEGTEVEIPILAGWDAHNIHVSAVVFRPADAEEKITPNRSVGLIHLPLDRSHRKLGIELEAEEKVRPNGPLPVTLRLEAPPRPPGPVPADPEPVHVTLAAVDVGILNITDFETPDPFGYFFERRRFSVNAYDIYGRVIENRDGGMAALRYGGDADLTGGKRPESRVELLSLFAGPVAFNENGEATVTLDLPDFNGKVRLMAVAFDRERFGAADREVTVAAPVVTQLAKPRFLAPGDDSVLTLDVHNRIGSAAEFQIRMTAEGPLTLPDGERTLNLADDARETLRFPVQAPESSAFGTATIRLRLEGPEVAIDRSWELGIRPGYPAVARKEVGILDPETAFVLPPGIASDLIPETVEADLKLSPTVPLNVREAIRGLIAFPYGCLEQTTSRAFPYVLISPEEMARYDLPGVTPAERLHRIESALTRIGSMQLASGGFGLWRRQSPEAPWLTVFVADFLLTARDQGVDIPAGLLDPALNRLVAYLQRGVPESGYMDNAARPHYEFAVRSYAAYVLSRVNRAPLGSLRPLFDNHRENARSPLPLVHLGLALQKMGDGVRGADAIAKGAERRSQDRGWWGDYGSSVRDLALSAALLLESGVSDGLDRILPDLLDALRGRRWMSTQEKSAVVRAGLALNQRADDPWRGRLTVGAETTTLDRRGAFVTSLSPEEIADGVRFDLENPDRLYASAVVGGYPRTPPPPDDEMIRIRRALFTPAGEPLERREFRVGELLLVHLSVAAKQRVPDALVVDLLPAGFEIENQNLKHGARLDTAQIDGEPIAKLRESADLRHEEFRDDRYVAAAALGDHQVTHLFYLVRVVSPGTFVVPAPMVESMYRPEIRGIGETPGAVTVRNATSTDTTGGDHAE